MKESYREELAIRSDLEPYAGDGDVAGVAPACRRQVGESQQGTPNFQVNPDVKSGLPLALQRRTSYGSGMNVRVFVGAWAWMRRCRFAS